MENERKGRIKWIDCAKTIAILGVLVDHSFSYLYQSTIIAYCSYFSVSLFVILSGMSALYSTRKRKIVYKYQLARIGNMYLQYAFATFLIQVCYTRFFDLKTYIMHLMGFTIDGPYYFLLFFFQLLLIAPILLTWYNHCCTFKLCNLLHVGTLLFLAWVSSICVRYTYILPVHGGGKFLFGGTYLLLYYLGIVLAGAVSFNLNLRKRLVMLGSVCIFTGTWVFMNVFRKLPFDSWMQQYWGDGINPPSISLMVYAIAMLFICYALFTILEEISAGKKLVTLLAIIGRNTLFVFMFHLLTRYIISAFYPQVLTNSWSYFLFAFLPMIGVPVIVAESVKKIKLRG